MIFWGHIGTSLYAGQRLSRLAPGWSQLAALAFCGMLPDLVDKPLFYLGLTPIPSGRVWAHSLLFSGLWLLACRSWLPALWPWAWATPGHLLLDSMWNSPHTLFWPFLGNVFDLPEHLFANHWEHWLWLYHNQPWSAAWLLGAELTGLTLAAKVLWSGLAARQARPVLAVAAPPPRGGAGTA